MTVDMDPGGDGRGAITRCVLVFILAVSSLFAQTDVQRPHVLGLAHVAFRVNDLNKTGAFYENVLGYAEPFSFTEENGKTAIALVKVNDEQHVELLQGEARSRGQLDHFALYTDDLAAMRKYLMAKRVPIVIDIHQGRVGNPFLTIRDPDGRLIEIVQYSPNSLTGQSQGKSMPASRVSSHISHVGRVADISPESIDSLVLTFGSIPRGAALLALFEKCAFDPFPYADTPKLR